MMRLQCWTASRSANTMSTSNPVQTGQLDPQILADLANQNFSDFQHQPSGLGDPRGNLPSGVASHSFQPNASLDLATIAQQALSSLQQQSGNEAFVGHPNSLGFGDPRGNLPSGVASHSIQPPSSLDVNLVPQQALGGAQQQAGH